MSVSAELAKGAQAIEYFLCVEGVGWPTDEADLSSGFDGTVFVTNDINGDLASILDCSIHHGLALPQSISDSFDPRSYDYDHGSMPFDVQESEGNFLEATFRPHNIALTAEVQGEGPGGALLWGDTLIQVDNGSTLLEGDVVWVAFREAILLGSKALVGGTAYSFTGSTRGYLGTPKGKRNPRPTGLGAFAWESDTKVYSDNRLWHARRVALFVHVPGEAVANCTRMYNGRLRPFKAGGHGTLWNFSTVAAEMVGATRIRETPSSWMLRRAQYFFHNVRPISGVDANGSVGYGGLGEGSHPESYGWRLHAEIIIGDPVTSIDEYEAYASAFFYNYRGVPGGTAGVKTAAAADPTDPQADDGSGPEHRIDAIARIGDVYVKVVKKMPELHLNHWFCEPWDINYNQNLNLEWQPGVPIRFMLDNDQDSWRWSRFSVNQKVSRNIVDVFLMFATSMNNEFYIGDSNGGDADSIQFAAPDWTTDEWTGYALHCVEGDQTGESRTIDSNNGTTTELTRAFTGVPGAVELQIRNTIYDVLPLGWGLGIHNSQIDVESFEIIRDLYLQHAEVGKFCLGDTNGYDLWGVLVENLCKPYGIVPYISRTTGKVTAVYVGETLPDGMIHDYISVTTADLIDLGDIEYSAQVPVGQIDLKVRPSAEASISPVPQDMASPLANTGPSYGISGAEHSVYIRPVDTEEVFEPSLLDTMSFRAMFNSVFNSGWVATEMANRLRRYAVAPPTVTCSLGPKYVAGDSAIHIGSMLSITDVTKFNPIDPFNGGRGWTNQLARAIEVNIKLSASGPALDCTLQLLASVNAAKIAPAANVTGKGNDGGGDYFEIEPTDFVLDPNNDRDDDEFAVDDRIEVRDSSGAVIEAEVIKTIDTGNDRIYVDGTIVAAMAAGYYITLAAWTASNTAHMDTFAGLADSDEELGADPDEARQYV